MTKAKILLALISILTIFTLTSCAGLFGDSGTGDPAKPSGNEKVVFKQIVISNPDVDIISVRSDIFDLVGRIGTALAEDPATEGEIIFGDTDRSATLAAKAELENLAAAEGDDAGYIIYFDGKNLATYWSGSELESVAIARFKKICIEEKKLQLESGVVDYATFTAAEIERDAMWISIEATASPEVYNALKMWYNNFDGRQITSWLANLWDPEIGGFYYSNSARDNEPFRPDLESVYQTLSFLTGNQAIKNVNKELPHEIREKIVAFVKSLQHPTEGYFLHPQWGTSYKQLQLDRYGRDLSWGIAILKQLKLDTDGDGVLETQYPNYCTPSGFKCEEHSKNGGMCNLTTVSSTYTGSSSALVTTVTSDVGFAVSKIPSSTVHATASTSPDYSTAETFLEWLRAGSPNVKENSGDAHVINALQDEIIAHGYASVLIDFLEASQIEVYEEQTAAGITPSGLWQYEANYRAVWGIHKYSTFYTSAKRSMLYHKEMVASCIKVILSEANGSYAMNDIMNQWTAIGAVRSNAKTYNPDDLDEIEKMLSENAVAMINQTKVKLEDFALPDGMYAYTTSGKSLSTIYGVPASLGEAEADVNGQLLLGSCYRAVYSAFGFNVVPLCTSDDGKNFVDIIMNCEPIEKKPLAPVEVLDFEDSEHIKSVSMAQKDPEAFFGVTEDITGENDNVLQFFSPATTLDRSDNLSIKAGRLGGGDCNIVEFDFYVLSAPNAPLFQTKIGSGFMIQIYQSSGYLRMVAISDESGSALTQEILPTSAKISASEWHTIRVEVYDDNGEGLPVLKLFVDEELYGMTSVYYGSRTGAKYNSTLSSISFYSMRGVTTDVYIDNVFINREYKVFDAESDDISDARG